MLPLSDGLPARRFPLVSVEAHSALVVAVAFELAAFAADAVLASLADSVMPEAYARASSSPTLH